MDSPRQPSKTLAQGKAAWKVGACRDVSVGDNIRRVREKIIAVEVEPGAG